MLTVYLDIQKFSIRIIVHYPTYRLHAVAQWLRHSTSNRKVAGLIPDGFIGIFHWYNPSGRTIALGSTQPLTEISKGKVIQLQGLIGPEGSRRLRLPDFKPIGT
jgi:hypothetical protein